MKKIIFVLFIFFLTGCSNYNDINNIAVISSIGIDFNNNMYTVYVNVLSSNKENESNVYTENCSNLNECFDNLNNKLMKRLYLTHLDLLMLGNSLNKDNFDHIFNFFLKEKTSRNSFSVIIVDSFNEKLFEYNTEDINNMVELTLNSNGIAKNISLDNIIKDVLNYELSYVPYLVNSLNLEVKGYKSIYSENKILSEEDSISVSLIKNYLTNFSLLINEKEFALEECNSINLVYDNEIDINISCKYKGESLEDVSRIENYLKTIINNFINKNSDNYFKYLYYKYKNKYSSDISYKVNVDIDYRENNGGEMFE